MTRKEFLEAVGKCILQDRNSTYSGPEDNFRRTAQIWNAVMEGRLVSGKEFTPQDVAMLLCGLKLARLNTSPDHMDSWVDMAGYAGCGAECASSKNKPHPMHNTSIVDANGLSGIQPPAIHPKPAAVVRVEGETTVRDGLPTFAEMQRRMKELDDKAAG